MRPGRLAVQQSKVAGVSESGNQGTGVSETVAQPQHHASEKSKKRAHRDVGVSKPEVPDMGERQIQDTGVPEPKPEEKSGAARVETSEVELESGNVEQENRDTSTAPPYQL